MSKNDSITVNPDSQLVICHTRIKGIETTSEVVRDEREGTRHETERTTTRVVANVREHREAKKIESLARAAVRKFALHTPIGNVSDGQRVASLRARFTRIEEQAAEHNERAEHHKIHVSLLVLPIAAALGPEAQRALCEEVTTALDSVTQLLRSGDVEGVRSWRMRNRNLDALMPEVIAGALRTALGEIGEAQRALTREIKNGKDAATVGSALDLSTLEVAASLILPAQAPAEVEAA